MTLAVAEQSSSVTVADTSQKSYSYTITSDATSSSPVNEGGQITYTITRDDSGTASTIYVLRTQSIPRHKVLILRISAVDFASDETVKTVTVDTLTDSLYEPSDEYVYLMLFKSESALDDFDYHTAGTGLEARTHSFPLVKRFFH